MRDWRAVIEAGLDTLRRSGAGAACQLLEPAANESDAPAAVWMLLADARGSGGDAPGREQALDEALRRDGRFLPALLAKGDIAIRRGDDRAAVSFLGLALSSAPPDPPPTLAGKLQQAQRLIGEAHQRFAHHLEQTVATLGPEEGRPARFDEALDLLLGRKQVQVQQPTSFYFPGLPQTAFHDPDDHPWTRTLAAAAPAMRREVEALLEDRNAFHPYLEHDASRANRGHELLDDDRWSAFFLWKNGAPVADNAARCPETMRALECAPIPMIPGRAPNILFSLLRPKSHIAPHWGMLNTRLICHIPLIVPDGCRLRVGNHERKVEEATPLLFDDSIEHEAWNDSDETRVVLLLEVWNPALTAAERDALTSLFAAINLYGEA